MAMARFFSMIIIWDKHPNQHRPTNCYLCVLHFCRFFFFFSVLAIKCIFQTYFLEVFYSPLLPVSSYRLRESSQDYSSRTLWAAYWHEKWPGGSIRQVWPVFYWRLQKPLQTKDRGIQWHCWWVDAFSKEKKDW